MRPDRHLALGTAASSLLLAGLLAGCGSDGSAAAPDGVLGQDQVTGATGEAKPQTRLPNQVSCQGIDDAEDDLVYGAPARDGKDGYASALTTVKADGAKEYVDSSWWRAADPQAAVAKIAAGVAACAKQDPGYYEPLASVPGHDGAIGYTARQGKPALYIHRVFVPVKDRVVVVGVMHDGEGDFSVEPQDLVDDAVDAARSAS